MNTSSGIRILLATDEVSDMPDYARQIFDTVPGAVHEEAAVTRGLAAETEVRGLHVQTCEGDCLADTLLTRSCHLGFNFDAVVLASVRVWALGRTLDKWASGIRELPDEAMNQFRVRLKRLPIIIGMPLNLLWNARKTDKGFDHLLNLPEVTVQDQGQPLADAIAQALGQWQAAALLDMGTGRLGISLDETGACRLNAFYTLPAHETAFFGPPNGSSPQYLRFPREFLKMDSALQEMEAVLREVQRLGRHQQEPVLQKFLENHPELLTLGTYDKIWPQENLRSADPLQSNIIPDFVMKNSGGYPVPVPPKVMEIKTSEAPLLTSRGFSGFLLDALDQLRGRYARYLENPRNHGAQIKAFGSVLEKPRFALLIGRRPHREKMEKLRQGIQDSEWQDVQIVTYDDLLDHAAAKAGFLAKLTELCRKKPE